MKFLWPSVIISNTWKPTFKAHAPIVDTALSYVATDNMVAWDKTGSVCDSGHKYSGVQHMVMTWPWPEECRLGLWLSWWSTFQGPLNAQCSLLIHFSFSQLLEFSVPISWGSWKGKDRLCGYNQYHSELPISSDISSNLYFFPINFKFPLFYLCSWKIVYNVINHLKSTRL